jgi:adenosine kinase
MEKPSKKYVLERKPGFVLDSCATTSKMPAYDSLLDSNLKGFLSNKRVRKQLVRQGLVTPTQITSAGAVVADKHGTVLPTAPDDLFSIKERFVHSLSPERRFSKKKFKKEVKPLSSAELQDVITAHQPKLEESKTAHVGPRLTPTKNKGLNKTTTKQPGKQLETSTREEGKNRPSETKEVPKQGAEGNSSTAKPAVKEEATTPKPTQAPKVSPGLVKPTGGLASEAKTNLKLPSKETPRISVIGFETQSVPAKPAESPSAEEVKATPKPSETSQIPVQSYKVMGIGNPLLDISAEVPLSVLERYSLTEGTSALAVPEHLSLFQEIIQQYQADYVAGGASQNSIRAAQWLSQTPGFTALFGCVNDTDSFSSKLREVLAGAGVTPFFQSTSAAPTGSCAALITGKERTLIANVGAAEKFTPDFLDANWSMVETASIYYHEGFFLVSSLLSCLKLALYSSSHDKTYAINISAEFIAETYKDALGQVLLYADFVFCNETEAKKFAQVNGIEGEDTLEIAQKIAGLPKEGSKPRTMIVTQGSRSTVVATASGVQSIPVPPVDKSLIVDTNGAGDSFVGGFLAELAKGSAVERCVAAGHYVASEVIKMKGCRFPEHPSFPSL